jgi:hypothetical protein
MSIVQKYKDLLGADYDRQLGLMRWFVAFFGGNPMSEAEIWEGVERLMIMAPKIAAASMVTAQEAADGMARFASAK